MEDDGAEAEEIADEVQGLALANPAPIPDGRPFSVVVEPRAETMVRGGREAKSLDRRGAACSVCGGAVPFAATGGGDGGGVESSYTRTKPSLHAVATMSKPRTFPGAQATSRTSPLWPLSSAAR